MNTSYKAGLENISLVLTRMPTSSAKAKAVNLNTAATKHLGPIYKLSALDAFTTVHISM